ncbi:Transcription factor, partial [Penicillium freii]
RYRDYYYSSSSTAVIFSVLAASIAALGLFLSPNKYPGESRLVEYAKAILEDPASIYILGIDYIIVGAIRIVLYTIIYLYEAARLYEEENIKKIASIASAAIYTYILLAINTLAISVYIATTFKGLKNLVKATDIGIIRRALSIAQYLLSLNIAKKRKELAWLEAVKASYKSF